ncbi:uncharacterized protein VTP21DRAFT_6015 [Calcarisporiella thermophila]|uniref:uncharacterized protein n=1 Tax=Calcarisporiella thermophila TaxID=911321 RepID=UPI0037422392
MDFRSEKYDDFVRKHRKQNRDVIKANASLADRLKQTEQRCAALMRENIDLSAEISRLREESLRAQGARNEDMRNINEISSSFGATNNSISRTAADVPEEINGYINRVSPTSITDPRNRDSKSTLFAISEEEELNTRDEGNEIREEAPENPHELTRPQFFDQPPNRLGSMQDISDRNENEQSGSIHRSRRKPAINYALPNIRSKLRQGDPFTDNFGMEPRMARKDYERKRRAPIRDITNVI